MGVNGYLVGTRFTVSDDAEPLSIFAYIYSGVTNQEVKGAIYRVSDNKLMAYSDAVTVSNPYGIAWKELPISTIIENLVGGVDYYIVFMNKYSTMRLYYTSYGGSDVSVYKTEGWGLFDNTLTGFSTSTYKFCLYCTYDYYVADSIPQSFNLNNDGISQVGINTTISCNWIDDIGLGGAYLEHNFTGVIQNISISISGLNDWANISIRNNFTYGLVGAYRQFAYDSLGQYNVTNYQYITFTPLYLTLCQNNTYGNFYHNFNLVSNNTEYPYNYNETVLLLGATYNSSFIINNYVHELIEIEYNPYNYLTDGNKTIFCNFDIYTSGVGSLEGYIEEEYILLFAIICFIIAIIIVFIFNENNKRK